LRRDAKEDEYETPRGLSREAALPVSPATATIVRVEPEPVVYRNIRQIRELLEEELGGEGEASEDDA
jgi:hypothetical protein